MITIMALASRTADHILAGAGERATATATQELPA
jgi:hypothetical protein